VHVRKRGILERDGIAGIEQEASDQKEGLNRSRNDGNLVGFAANSALTKQELRKGLLKDLLARGTRIGEAREAHIAPVVVGQTPPLVDREKVQGRNPGLERVHAGFR